MISCNSKDVVDEVKKYSRFSTMEFIVGTKCQNACRYCYRTRFQNEGPILPLNRERMRIYFDNAREMGLIDRPNQIEFFGGDPMIDMDAFNGWVDEFKQDTNFFSIPTNGRMLERLSDIHIQEMIDNAAPAKLMFSLSIDGISEPFNRPLSAFGHMQGFKQGRDWKRVFDMAKKFHMGFHPMLDFEEVYDWFNVWNFFQKEGVHLYLLEVRHPVDEKEKLVQGVVEIAKILKTCKEKNIPNTFNTTQPHTTMRGLPCSALTNLSINTDGKVYFCHRLLNEKYLIADVVTKQINMRKFVALGAGYNFHNSASCMQCPIRNVCPTMCVGAMDEYWNGAMSTPIPSVCAYYLLKYSALTMMFEEWKQLSFDLDEAIHACKHYFGDNVYDSLMEKVYTNV